jgi:hypothetical protein
MPIQPSTFTALPPKDVLLERIEQQQAHIADLTSYMWFVCRVAERFGDRAYEVAAEFLSGKGFDVTPAMLQELGAELLTPEGRERYYAEKRRHAALLFGGGSGPRENA